MREFNYARAHREWAAPQFENLPESVKQLWERVVSLTDKLAQDRDLSVPWPAEDLPDGTPSLQDAFLSIPPDVLAKAAFVINYWGHWAHIAAITVVLPSGEQHRFVGNDHDPFSPRHEVTEWVKEHAPDDNYTLVIERAGPDNEKTVGAYWKFEKLAKRSMIERGHVWNEKRIASELGYDTEAFMDHKPGTEYSNDEKHTLFVAPLMNFFVPVKVLAVNFKPHPFTIGPRHVAYAADHCCGILGQEALESAPCAARDCNVSYSGHTHDTVLVLRLTRNLTNEEATACLLRVKELMETNGIDGFVFERNEFEIAPAQWSVEVRCHTDVPREAWDPDDQETNPVGTYTFMPRAKNEDAAREAALDEFHRTVPIHNLETFEVEVTVLPRGVPTDQAAAVV